MGPTLHRLISIEKLERLCEIAKSEGIEVRNEWLGGVAGGLVRIGTVATLFIDQSLSVPEQLAQVRRSLAPLDWSETTWGGEILDLLAEGDSVEGLSRTKKNRLGASKNLGKRVFKELG
jgi:hypothetical protein